MGHLLVPEARAAARWAYINATYLATNLQEVDTLASVCSLYPCMRTYTSSVANNLLTETLVRSTVMHLDLTTLQITPKRSCTTQLMLYQVILSR